MTLPNLALLAAKKPAGGGGGATITYVGSRQDGTMAEPAGTQEGDLVIALPRTQFGPSATITPPAAYTAIRTWAVLTGYNEMGGIYWAVRGASALSSDWTPSTSWVGPILVAYRGVSTSAPINASDVNENRASVSTFDSITTTVSNCMIVGVELDMAFVAKSSSTFTTARVNGTSGARCHAWEDGILATAGASGANTVNNSFSNGSQVSAHIALAPA